VADYSDLIARLEKAEGGDVALDLAVCVALQWAGPHAVGSGIQNVRRSDDEDDWLFYEDVDGPCCDLTPRLSASLDAAIALTEKMLPGWRMALVQDGPKLVEAILSPNSMDSEIGRAKTLPIALLIATLKALQSLEQKDAA